MKTYLFHLTVFVATFTLSLTGVSAFNSIAASTPDVFEASTYEEKIPAKHILSGEIQVRYLGFEEFEDRIFANFEITNGTSEPVSYRGYTEGEIAGNTLFYNNEEFMLGICGTGLQTFYLPAGASIRAHAHEHQFAQHKKNDGVFQVAFWLGEHGQKSKFYKSNEFRLSEDVKRKLKEK